jgi:tripeptide aminopeptidase
VAAGVAFENRRWAGRNPVSAAIQLVGDRPVGSTDENDGLVRSARRVSEALGIPVRPSESSTDANFPMTLGIPAITIGGGGSGSGEHSLDEMFDGTGSEIGSERALLVALAASSTDK